MWIHIYCRLLTSLGSNAINSKSAKTIERDSTQTTYVSAAAARKVKFSNGVSDLDYSAFVLTIWYSASNEWRQGFNYVLTCVFQLNLKRKKNSLFL